FSSSSRHTRFSRDWSSDVCSSDLCGYGCSIGAAFQTTTSLLPMARATGRLRIVTDAMVNTVTTDADGQVTGVAYIDKKTGTERQIGSASCREARMSTMVGF